MSKLLGNCTESSGLSDGSLLDAFLSPPPPGQKIRPSPHGGEDDEKTSVAGEEYECSKGSASGTAQTIRSDGSSVITASGTAQTIETAQTIGSNQSNVSSVITDGSGSISTIG